MLLEFSLLDLKREAKDFRRRTTFHGIGGGFGLTSHVTGILQAPWRWPPPFGATSTSTHYIVTYPRQKIAATWNSWFWSRQLLAVLAMHPSPVGWVERPRPLWLRKRRRKRYPSRCRARERGRWVSQALNPAGCFGEM